MLIIYLPMIGDCSGTTDYDDLDGLLVVYGVRFGDIASDVYRSESGFS